MQTLLATTNQMLVLFSFMILGYFLNIKGILPKNASTTISKLETTVLVPCLTFNTFYKYCTVENISKKWNIILYSSIVVIISIIIAFFLAKLFSKDLYLNNIYKYSFTISNLGFMGNAVVLGVFGEEVLFDYLIYTLPFQIYIYSVGIVLLKPISKDNKLSFKTLINPVFLSVILGTIVGLIGIPLPNFLESAISSAGACMSPMAMILTGFVVANYSFKMLLKQKKIYIASLIRLVVLPLFFVLVLRALKTNENIVMLTLCCTAMPLGLNTIVFPAAFGGDTTPGASMALISSILSIVTIPILFGIFI